MAVDRQRVPAERVPAGGDVLHAVSELRGHALPESVDVDDAAQVVELIAKRDARGFPDRSFRHLTVAEQDVRAIVGLNTAGVQRRADGGADALAERSGGDVDERQPRRRMAFEVGINPPELQEILTRKQPRVRPRRVENRRSMSLGEHETIVVGILRIPRVEPHLAEEQRRDDLGRGHAGRGVAAASFGGRENRIDPELGGEVAQRVDGCCHRNPAVYHWFTGSERSRTASR